MRSIHLTIPALMMALLSAPSPSHAQAPVDPFPGSDQCLACHNGLSTPTGQDISMGTDWRASMMANAARDPYWQAAVRRETLDHPKAAAAIEDECSKCHMPMHRALAHAQGGKGQIIAHLPLAAAATPEAVLAADGVSCSMCHQIGAEGLGTKESFTGGFVVDTATLRWQGRKAFGPFDPGKGLDRLMESAAGLTPAKAAHIQSAELCATCHTLYTHSLGPDGQHVGTLPEQVPYLEWKHSVYSGNTPCQRCHMPEAEGDAPAASVLGEPRKQVSRHVFRGGNFVMPRIFARHADELGVQAQAGELEAMGRRTADNLQEATARLTLTPALSDSGTLELSVEVENMAGHKLPTAYPSRRAWLQVAVFDATGEPLFESGALADNGSIVGNDNDADPTRYEPHHDLIDAPDQVALFEAILADPDGKVTTGLLTASQYVKDSRILPAGFDKATAEPDIAPYGAAATDSTFVGGRDTVRYRVDLARAKDGPLRIEATLWYQPIGFRWAENLRSVDAPEPKRFNRYFDELGRLSAIQLVSERTSLVFARMASEQPVEQPESAPDGETR